MTDPLKCFLEQLWIWLHPAFTAALVTIEIAIVGLLVSWRQLRYMQQRDAELDIRNGWIETHKLMMTFRFKRGLLDMPFFASFPASAEAVIAVSEALHNLKGHLDRLPDGPLVEQFADFLHSNWEAEKWRSQEFENQFDEYVKKVAKLAHPTSVVK